MIPTIAVDEVPRLSRSQMIEVDRAMVEDYRIDLVRMMEAAGNALARLALTRFLDGDARRSRVMVLAGTGGNGGGALVAARRLHNRGADVNVVLTRPADAFTPVARRQIEIVQRIGIPVGSADQALPVAAELIIDGIIGYSLHGAPTGAAERLIRWANGEPAPILSLDVPSGIDASTGAVSDPSIRASATMTLALPKAGLTGPDASANVGGLYLADIGVPPDLYRRFLGIDPGEVFASSDLVELVQ